MRVLIVPDKFKGTLTAREAARAMARGWRRVRPADDLEQVPMSDGGDGFGPVIGQLLGARQRTVATLDAAHRPCRSRWWWAADRRLAILEAAQSNGLALLPTRVHHPFDLDTAGVGALVRAASRAGAERCLLGVGGSATNDGGFGMARALGWQFLDRRGQSLDRWTDLRHLVRLEPPPAGDSPVEFMVATDVSNPLLGPDGATRVYGPQKGLRPRDLPVAEAALRRLAQVVERQLGFDSWLPGCGAAGGLGFGLQAFLGARRQLGFDVFAEYADLDRRIASADLVVTGEGAMDRSTLMGKGVGQLLVRCRRHRKPVVAVAGRLGLGHRPPEGVVAMASLVEFAKPAEAMARSAAWVEHAATVVAQRWSARRESPIDRP